MITDVVGYSRLIELDAFGTAMRLRSLYRYLIVPCVKLHGGRVADRTGDSCLSVFKKPNPALRCAIAIQNTLDLRGRQGPPGQRLRLRIGISAGEILVIDGAAYGIAINIAARMQRLAKPGDIYLCEAIHANAARALPLSFEVVGSFQLRNISSPVVVYRVAYAGRKGRDLARPNATSNPSDASVDRARRHGASTGGVSQFRVAALRSPSTGSHDPGRSPNPGRERTGHGQNRSLRERISPRTSASPARSRPKWRRMAGSSQRKKGFVSFSSPSSDGTVGSPRRRCSSTFWARDRSRSLSPSTVSAKRALLCVYSWPARHQRVVGQRPQLGQRGLHRGGVALEQPAAAQREQRIGTEQRPVVGEPEGNVAAGVARGLDHARNPVAQAEQFAFGDTLVEAGDPRRVLGWPDDAAARLGLERQVAAHMVAMVVR